MKPTAELRASLAPHIGVLLTLGVSLKAAHEQLAGRMAGAALLRAQYSREQAAKDLKISPKHVTAARRMVLRSSVPRQAAEALQKIADLLVGAKAPYRDGLRLLGCEMVRAAMGGDEQRERRRGTRNGSFTVARRLGVHPDTVSRIRAGSSY